MHAGTIAEAQSRLVIHQMPAGSSRSSFAEDVRTGLLNHPKRLAPKYFYDQLGSQLFEAICLLPEYYPTRAETEIFENYAGEIVAQFEAPISIVELGSGSSIKTRLLIESTIARQRVLHYQPIDISASILEQSADKLLGAYPELTITGRVLDYTLGLGKIDRRPGERLLVLFLGSNIGNYTPQEAEFLLRDIRRSLQPGDGLLLGADLKKSVETLEAAYDDSLGVTAAFNLNLLGRINRELAADFNLSKFKHRALYDPQAGCVEIHLVSVEDQVVTIEALDEKIGFAEGETIHTESSYKYDLDQLAWLAEKTGFRNVKTWLDSGQRFSCNFWRAE